MPVKQEVGKVGGHVLGISFRIFSFLLFFATVLLSCEPLIVSACFFFRPPVVHVLFGSFIYKNQNKNAKIKHGHLDITSSRLTMLTTYIIAER